jgi:plastocyanin
MKAVRSTTILVGILALAPMCPAQREFTSSDGKKLRADIVSASDSEVTLKRDTDGKDYTIPLDRLSEADQSVVKGWLAKRKLNTRPQRQVTLSLKDGQTKTVEVPEGEYLAEDGTLTLFPGDTIHLEFDESGNPHVVSVVKNPKRTVTFSMSQEESMTMLTRKTQMQETVAMDCTHLGLGSDRYSRTNLRPTEKGLAAFDSWPGTVWSLRLNNFEVTDRSASDAYNERVSK